MSDGVRIPSDLRRENDAATYALIEAALVGGGGFHVVADETARDAIVAFDANNASNVRADGLLVYLIAENRFDQLRGGTDNANWVTDVLSGGGGGGSTVRVNSSLITNPDFNDTTPAAPAGGANGIWQEPGSGDPRSVSVHVPAATESAPGVTERLTQAEADGNTDDTRHLTSLKHANHSHAFVDHNALTNYAVGEHRTIDDVTPSTTSLYSSSKIDSLVAAAVNGKDWKDNVETVATSNITLSGEQTINGVLTLASRVGVVGQTDPAENGIYVTAAGAWSRATDADADAEVTNGLAFMVSNASSTKNRFQYVITTSDPITVGVTPITFAEITPLDFGSGAGQATEGNDPRIPTQDENDALAGTSGAPSTSNRYVTNDDARNTNARTPTAHAASHQHGGSDEVATATPAANAIPKADGSGKLNDWVDAASADDLNLHSAISFYR